MHFFLYGLDEHYPFAIEMNSFLINENSLMILSEMGFKEVKKAEEISKKKSAMISKKGSHILEIKQLGMKGQREVGPYLAKEKEFKEKITPQAGYYVYRYRGMCLMSYAHMVREWELAITEDFFKRTEEARLVLSRFLAHAFVSNAKSRYQVEKTDFSPPLSFFGKVKDGKTIWVARPEESQGNSFFIDFKRNVLIEHGNEKKLQIPLSIYRKNELQIQSSKMTSDELYCFTTQVINYFDYGNLGQKQKDFLVYLSQNAVGIVAKETPFDSSIFVNEKNA